MLFEESYRTVFAVTDKSFPVLVPMVFAGMFICATFVVAGIVWTEKKLDLAVILVYIVFATTCTLVCLLTYSRFRSLYQNAQNQLTSGRFFVAEGTVTNFHAMPYEGHQDESFEIGNMKFSYSDFHLSPCFNQSTSHGGPIHEGMHVRASYSGNCILKLEVATDH